MMKRILAGLMIAGAASTFMACETAPKTAGQRIDLQHDARGSIARAKREDPTMKTFFDDAHGYVVFPNIGKGGFIAGGAYGRGVVYEKGQMVGYADISQATVGAQVGGQDFSEIIFFQYKEAMDHFKTGNWALAANATAVAIQSGAGASADYDRGVAVFVLPKSGLMVEAAVGGQKFSYVRP